MSEQIKYEHLWGDSELFKHAPVDAVVAVQYANGIDYYSESYPSLGVIYTSEVSIAMRRIIRTPTWTVADQQAGKLPEVGCRIYVPMMHEEQNVIYSSEKVIVSISDNGGAVTRTEVGSIDRIKPIETPEEKAARMREEWCSNALGSASILSGMQEYELKRLGGYIGNIYDALLSGDLPVPVKE